MIINFKFYKISQDMHKLTQIFLLIIIKKIINFYNINCSYLMVSFDLWLKGGGIRAKLLKKTVWAQCRSHKFDDQGHQTRASVFVYGAYLTTKLINLRRWFTFFFSTNSRRLFYVVWNVVFYLNYKFN